MFIHVFPKFIIGLYLENSALSDVLCRFFLFCKFYVVTEIGYSRSEEQQALDVQNSSRTRALTKSAMASPDLRNSFRIFRADMEQVVLWLIIEVSSKEKITPLKKGSCIVLALQIKGVVEICDSSNQDINVEVPASSPLPDE